MADTQAHAGTHKLHTRPAVHRPLIGRHTCLQANTGRGKGKGEGLGLSPQECIVY